MDRHRESPAADDDDAGRAGYADHAHHAHHRPDQADGPRRRSAGSQASSRRASRRTEALIHAAARDIVEHVGGRHHAADAADAPAPAADDAGDSSSHHEHDDDVFSDGSPRSSLGSMSEAEQTKIEQTLSQRNITQRVRSPRISDLPASDHDHHRFAAAVRAAPRPAFRSPSSVQALQMTSPPGTPRSPRRTPLPTVSRLASPSILAQYSPRKTPPRFKRATPPLVLLHVTLLPLRWAWGAVLDRAEPAGLSPEAGALRDAWRQLRDRTGDTVSDRGILLPHPQGDYEVLEERLLEALELPLRRRARILECGHYLGPANEHALADDADADADGRDDDDAGAHWCRTCRGDIRYESLGRARVFRVKVYASNGLMRAGAWEACWKEMERVDVELEPIVDAALHEELVHLLADQERALDTADEQREASEIDDDDDDDDEPEHDPDPGREPCSSPPRPAEAPPNVSPAPTDGDAEPLRQVYARAPQPRRGEMGDSAGDGAPRETSPSPARLAGRRRGEPPTYKTASLPALVLEAGRVLMQDKKNVMIALLSALVLMLAIRGARPAPLRAATPGRDGADAVPRYTVDAMAGTPAAAGPESRSATAADPCASSLEVVADGRERPGAGDASKSTMRVFETWRVVETVTETHTHTLSAGPAPALETDALARWGA